MRIGRNGKGMKVLLDPPWIDAQHAGVKDRIKAVSPRAWDPATKSWRIDVSVLVTRWADLLGDLPVEVTEEALEEIEEAGRRQQLSRATETADTMLRDRVQAALPSGLDLYPYQYAAVEFAERAGGRVLYGEEMGLGKTVEAVGYLALHSELRPAVVVSPAVVTISWQREIEKWLPAERVQRLRKGKDQIDPSASVIIVTYDLLKKHVEAITARQPQAVVADEVHAAKNIKAQRTQAFLSLASHASVKALLGLSGTPIVNRPLEFYTFLHLLRPEEYRSWWHYTERYCGGHYEQVARRKRVWVCDQATHTEELAERLRDLMIRRTKDQVLGELPPKTHQRLPVEMLPAESRQYRRAVKGQANPLAAITAGRQAAGQIKVRAALDQLTEYQTAGTPALVFAHHQDVLDGLAAGCAKLGIRFGRIDGSVSQERRGCLVDDFQCGKLDVMLLSVRAAGVGITLTRASEVLFVEQDWTPGAMRQAEDRAHRIGQERAVTVRTLVVENTVDEQIYDLLEQKREILDAILDGGGVPPGTLDIRAELEQMWSK